MATVTTPERQFDRTEADRRVRHPLDAVRRYIRRYVLIEGLALTIIFAAVCFWIGLGLDFLLWSGLAVDWLYSFTEASGVGPTVFLRVTILAVASICLGALITFKLIRRYVKDFSDKAVALLLERCYRKELGDRLITAVELADPRLAANYGYSQAMVDTTIRAAAERVEMLPVREVFRWGRLRVLVALALLATLGMFILVGLAWCVLWRAGPGEYMTRFRHTAGIWAERNLLMMHSYWPPSTLIELVRFPGEVLKAPREEDRPDVKARSIRWAIADQSAPRGWRALQVSDLPELLPSEMLDIQLPNRWNGWIVDLDDLDASVPAGAVPPEWGWQGATSGQVWRDLEKEDVKAILDKVSGKNESVRDAIYRMLDWRNSTLDRIEWQLQYTDTKSKSKDFVAAVGGAAAAKVAQNDKPVAAAMMAEHKASFNQFEAILTKLEEMANDPAMARTLRKMRDPGETEVYAQRKSKSGGGRTNCTPDINRKFIFPLAELKESCQFSIATRDFWTPWRKIELVPPPMLDRLTIDKEEPAYLYYRVPENPTLLKGKRQRISSVSVSTSGPYSRILVPVGADVGLTGHSDRKLKDIRVAEPDAAKREEKSSLTSAAIVDLAEDRQTFTCEFKDIRRILEFEFEFKDESGVKGLRRVIIMPLEDQPPRIHELALAVTPRLLHGSEDATTGIASGPRYIITPDAFLKWRGKVEDDRGLAKLEYKYELQELDFQNLFVEAEDLRPGEPKKPAKKAGRGLGPEIVTAGLVYTPGPSGYGYFAAAYFGGLTHALKDGSLPPPPPRVGFVPLERALQRLSMRFPWDASSDELERLLAIQPASRKLLLEALEISSDRALQEFVDRLKEGQNAHGFLREALDFSGVKGPERLSIETRARNDLVGALGEVLQQIKSAPEQLAASRKVLDKQPEKTILLKYELQDEEAAFGFDVKERLAYIKPIGSTTAQKHHALRLSIVATDNNVETGPGTASATLPYSFLIVSENELLSLMMIDQRKHYLLLYAATQELDKTRNNLRGQLSDYRTAADDPTKLLVRADAARKALRDGRITAKAIFERYEGLLREMEFNRMRKERYDKIKSRVADPLGVLTALKGTFQQAEDQAGVLYKKLSPDVDKKEKADAQQLGNDPALLKELLANQPTHIGNAENTLTEMDELIRDLNNVLAAMRDVVTDDEALEQLVQIEALHRAVTLQIRNHQSAFTQWLREGLLLDTKGKKDNK